MATTHEAVLKEIRERRDAAERGWTKIREEGRKNIKFVAGDPWETEDRKARGNRPTLTMDELGQYVNQAVNEIRLNNRAIRVAPLGSDTDGRMSRNAEVRQHLIRQIEYRSNARQQAYTTMFEGAVQRGFGWLRIDATYSGEQSFDQELVIREIPNPDLVLPDPDHQMADGSDLDYLFYYEWHDEAEFPRKFDAKTRSFSDADRTLAPQWFKNGKILVAEYWTKQVLERELLLIQTPQGAQTVYRDELTKGANPVVLKARTVPTVTVKQYLTNGIEILSESDWPGRHIPFVPCYGKVLFVEQGGTVERQILSLVSLARDPFKYYCFIRSTQCELVGMTPKFPWFVRKGSLSPAYLAALEQSNQIPAGAIEVEAMLPDAPGVAPEFPSRPDLSLGIGEYEVLAEGARRAIQAAMGTSPLPTSAQRRNEKSGKALQQIEEAGQKGSFHFVDHYEASQRRTGEILNDLLRYYYDTPRDVAIRKADDTQQVIRVNDPQAVNGETGEPELVSLTEGEFDVTIGSGPAFDSQREEASAFADMLLGTPFAQQVADLAIKLKNLGPVGDELADRLTPPPFRKPKDGKVDATAQAQQLQQAQQVIEALQQELERRVQQIETEAVKAEKDLRIAEMDNATKIRIAEISASVKGYAAEASHAAAHEAVALGQVDREAQRDHEAALSAMRLEQAAPPAGPMGPTGARPRAADAPPSGAVL